MAYFLTFWASGFLLGPVCLPVSPKSTYLLSKVTQQPSGAQYSALPPPMSRLPLCRLAGPEKPGYRQYTWFSDGCSAQRSIRRCSPASVLIRVPPVWPVFLSVVIADIWRDLCLRSWVLNRISKQILGLPALAGSLVCS